MNNRELNNELEKKLYDESDGFMLQYLYYKLNENLIFILNRNLFFNLNNSLNRELDAAILFQLLIL
jgi:hypothetical protein